MDQQDQHREMNLREYWQILARRRWLIYTCVLVTTVAAAIASLLATPLYRSTCSIKIERAGVKVLRQDLTTSEPSWIDYQNFYNTQYRILESERALRIAVEQLDLANRPGILQEKKSGLNKTIGSFTNKITRLISGEQDAINESERDPLLPYINMLKGGLTISPIRDSFLVELSFVADDPRFAAEVANAVAAAYRHLTLSEKMDVANQSSDWFVEQIGDLKSEVNELEFDLQEYARENQIVLGGDGDLRRQNLTDLRQQFVQAQVVAARKRARRDSIQRANPDSLEEVRQSGLIRDLTRELAEYEAHYSELLSTYGPEYPPVKTIKAKMLTAAQRREAETESITERVFQGAQAELKRAIREEGNLSKLLDNAKSELDVLDRSMIKYETMKLERERKQATLQDLMNRQNDMTLSAALGDTAHNVRVIDFAKPPTGRFKPKRKLNVMLGFIFGLFLGIGAAVVMEYIDNTIKSPEDVRAVIDKPVLGMIPSLEALSRGRDKDKDSAQEEPALITARIPLSPIAEAYRELRTAVLLATPGHPPRDITVTSCQPSEGKTTTAINLAIALSQLGRRVLLVDSDLRRPRCHLVLDTPSAHGVSSFLTGFDELDQLIKPTEVERLFLLPAGPVPPNPSELLDSKRFIELIHILRESSSTRHSGFDHVIFDSPPVLSVVDPLLIGRHTEGTVLVVRSAFTSREAGRLGKEKLESGRVNLLGVLLNAVHTEHVPYQYRYYRYGYSQAKPAEGPREGGRKSRRRVAGSSGSA